MTTPQVPVHLREEVFRKYEKVIAQVVKTYPMPSTFEHKPLSIQTYKCRLRDAMKSVLLYQWPTAIDLKLLSEIRPEIHVKENNGLVWVGRRDTQGDEPLDSAVPSHMPVTLSVDKPTLRDLYAFAHLLSERKIPAPILITNPMDGDIAKIETQAFDVAFRQEGDKFFMF